MSTGSLQIAEYLEAIDPAMCMQYCQQHQIPYLDVLPFTFQKGDEVYDCLSQFLDNGIPLDKLFLHSEIWGLYLRDITEPRYHNAIDMLMANGGPAELMLYFRACYRFGFPAMDDKSNDVLEQLYIMTFPSLRFLAEQTYDDDDYSGLVLDAIKMSGVRSAGKQVAATLDTSELSSNPIYADLNTEKSKSIRPVVTPEEAFEFWKAAPMCRVHFSLKIDGVNTKISFSTKDDEGLQLALSRGRAADSIDYTEAIRRVLKSRGVDDTKLAGRVTGESFVGLEVLPIIQSHYPDKDYKTPKSTAMAMLRAPDNFLEEDYQYLYFNAFDYNGVLPDKAFRLIQDAQIEVPPYLEFDGEDIPRDSLENFNAWMEEHVINPLYKAGEQKGVGSDGVVMFLLTEINTERKDKYSDSNIAIKYGPWGAATYQSTVKSIIFEQRRVEASIVLEIEPTIMRDRNTATRVGVGSPDILIRDNVRIGDVIEFERKSEAYNVYLRKK